MLILGTRDAGAVVLVDHRGARDDDTTLVNCLDHVSCANVSFCYYHYFLLMLSLGAGLAKSQGYRTSCTCCGARRGQRLTASGA
jgi:hypothetical protein